MAVFISFNSNKLNKQTVKDKMSQYVSFAYPEATNIRVLCGKYDTDQDGYVRCTAVFFVQDEQRKEVAECPVRYSDNCVPMNNDF